mmetsp:Transcript_151265/g.466561  ORF Transcript_151265/g.466561 Transcript_151265/m.466561 type:complete len:275 (+) Transcript_151265:201-1025(+)
MPQPETVLTSARGRAVPQGLQRVREGRVLQPEQGLLHGLEQRHRDAEREAEPVPDDGVPNAHDKGQWEAIDEEREEPLPEVHVRLDALPGEVPQQVRRPLLQELVTRLHVAVQQGEAVPEELGEAEAVHQADQHAEALLLALAAGQEEEQPSQAVHPLAVTNAAVVCRIGVEDAHEARALLLVEALESAVGVGLDQLRPLVFRPRQLAVGVAARQVAGVQLQHLLPDLPSEVRGHEREDSAVVGAGVCAHVPRELAVERRGPRCSRRTSRTHRK